MGKDENIGGTELGPEYEMMANKVGGVPNLKVKDNVYQAIAVGVFVIVGALVGLIASGTNGVLPGVLVGLVLGGFLSGLVLGIIGLSRKDS